MFEALYLSLLKYIIASRKKSSYFERDNASSLRFILQRT